MPAIPKKQRRREIAEIALDTWEDFAAGWKRSRRGNLWRLWQGLTLTIFERSDGYFGWSIADAEGVRFSRCGYETEDAAMGALADEIEIGM